MIGMLSLISGEMIGIDPVQRVWRNSFAHNGLQICVEVRLGRLSVEAGCRGINFVDDKIGLSWEGVVEGDSRQESDFGEAHIDNFAVFEVIRAA